MFISPNAMIGETFALRVCVINHRSTDDDVRAVVNEVLAVAEELSAELSL